MAAGKAQCPCLPAVDTQVYYVVPSIANPGSPQAYRNVLDPVLGHLSKDGSILEIWGAGDRSIALFSASRARPPSSGLGRRSCCAQWRPLEGSQRVWWRGI